MKQWLTLSIIGRIIAATLLFWALVEHPYGYYQVLRWVTCGVAAFCTAIAFRADLRFWGVSLGVVALLFNPLIPFKFAEQTWQILEVASGVIFLASIFFVSEVSLSATTEAESEQNTPKGE